MMCHFRNQRLQSHNTCIAAQGAFQIIARLVIPHLIQWPLVDTVFDVADVIRLVVIPPRVIPCAAIGPGKVAVVALFARCPDPAVIASIGCRVVLRVIVDGDQMAAIIVKATILSLTPSHQLIAHNEVPRRLTRFRGRRRGRRLSGWSPRWTCRWLRGWLSGWTHRRARRWLRGRLSRWTRCRGRRGLGSRWRLGT